MRCTFAQAACLLIVATAVHAQVEESREPEPEQAPVMPQHVVPVSRSQNELVGEPRVNWRGIRDQSAMFLGLQHAFRLGTEPQTRSGMKGPFFADYGAAVSSLHGWADGDPFYVNYVGHPMQGAVAAYIWNQNDPRYRMAEFGKNRAYWMGRARAAAFSFLYSAQFEGGPISEASIGNIQSLYPQQGFVDWVVTPVLGMSWMFAEDALDRYVVTWFERKVSNPYARILVRGWLNPSRSFTNMTAGRVPWFRFTRSSVWSYDPAALDSKPTPRGAELRRPDVAGPAPFEFVTNFESTQFVGSGSGGGCYGAGGIGAFRLSRSWQAVVDVGGCSLTDVGPGLSGDVLTYMIGPRWTSSGQRWSRHAQVLLGGQKVTHDHADRPHVSGEPAVLDDANAFALGAGGGIQYKVNSALAVQIASIEYRRSWMGPLNGIDYRQGIRFSTGVTLRVGTW